MQTFYHEVIITNNIYCIRDLEQDDISTFLDCIKLRNRKTPSSNMLEAILEETSKFT